MLDPSSEYTISTQLPSLSTIVKDHVEIKVERPHVLLKAPPAEASGGYPGLAASSTAPPKLESPGKGPDSFKQEWGSLRTKFYTCLTFPRTEGSSGWLFVKRTQRFILGSKASRSRISHRSHHQNVHDSTLQGRLAELTNTHQSFQSEYQTSSSIERLEASSGEWQLRYHQS